VADSADHSIIDGITRIVNVRMVFLDPQMGEIVLTADQGELLPENRTVKVRSNVKIISPPGNVILTEFLEYKESTNILHTDKEVRLNFDHFEVIGKGMQMDVENRNLHLLSNVKALLGS
jgi:LPS export ABC transporter protein LptC